MTQHDPQPVSFHSYELTFPKPEHHPSTYEPVFDDINDVKTSEQLDDRRTLERPTDAIIEHLRQDDPRIDVIHFGEDLNLERALADKLDKDFGDKDVIAMRAVEASLDGMVTDGETDAHDIRDILRMGEMSNRDSVNIAGYAPNSHDANDPYAMRIHHRVIQYATQTDIFRQFVVSGAEGSDKIFPVVLVYDASKMKPSGGHYGYDLPTDENERATVIQKAYVLDTIIQKMP